MTTDEAKDILLDMALAINSIGMNLSDIQLRGMQGKLRIIEQGAEKLYKGIEDLNKCTKVGNAPNS